MRASQSFGLQSTRLRARATTRLAIERLEAKSLLAVDLSLLKDINTLPGDVEVLEYELVGAVTFFSAKTPGSNGLYRTDGTSQGTRLLKSFGTGVGTTDMPLDLTNVSGKLYFSAGNRFGRELWSSDGTAGGTVMVKDIATNAGSYPGSLTNVGGTLYFAATVPGQGRELWKSNGTSAGTVQVKDIVPGAGSSSPEQITAVGSTLYFTASTPETGRELFISRGTAGTTALVRDIRPGTEPSNIQQMTAVAGKLFFTACDANNCLMWRSAGTSDTTVPISSSTNKTPRNLTEFNGALYFTSEKTADFDDEYLYRYNPTTSQTVEVKRFFRITNEPESQSNPDEFVNVNGVLYFVATSQTLRYLWRTDGTKFTVINEYHPSPYAPLDAMPFRDPAQLTSSGNTLYFWANNSSGRELWTTGPAGTRRLSDIRSGSTSTEPPTTAGAVAGKVLFTTADDNLSERFWSASPTSLVPLDFSQETDDGFTAINSKAIATVNGAFYFAASSSNSVTELWRSDGTANRTIRLASFSNPSAAEPLSQFTNLNGTLLFTVTTTTGEELWRSDGTIAGTSMLKQLQGVGNVVKLGSAVYFSGNTANHGTELWRSDGTAAGTVEVKDIVTGAGSSNIWSLTAVGQTLYFGVNDAQGNTQLWKSDGSTAGTTKIKTLHSSTSFLTNFVTANSKVYFFAGDFGAQGGQFNHSLWVTGGTTETTSLLIHSDDPAADLRSLSPLTYSVLFTYNDGRSGSELWRSDGTTTGTTLLKDIRAGVGSSSPKSLVTVKGTIYFTASDGTTGFELWKSNGTTAGTVLVKDIFVGSRSSLPNYLTNVNGTLYFAANDGLNGLELWSSDGTNLGTVMAADLNAGPGSSRPANMMLFKDRLLISAVGKSTGRELWIQDLPAAAASGTPMTLQPEGEAASRAVHAQVASVAAPVAPTFNSRALNSQAADSVIQSLGSDAFEDLVWSLKRKRR